MWVHYTEYESKQPQLELALLGPDGIALAHPRPDSRGYHKVPVLLPENPFETYKAGEGDIFVHSPNHGRQNNTIVRFRGTPERSSSTGPSGWPLTPSNGSPGFSDCLDVGGIPGSTICSASGHTISVGKRLPAKTTTLVADIDDSQTTGIKLTDPTNFSSVTTSNFLHQAILIGTEIIRYSTIASDNSLGQVTPEATALNPNVVLRGAYGTTKAAHSAGATITLVEDPDNYFSFSQGSTATTGGIQGGGYPVSAGPVTITP